MREKREQRKVIEKLRKNLVILKDSNFEYSIFNIKRHDNLYDTRRLLRESEERISILRVNIENKIKEIEKFYYVENKIKK